MSDHVNRLMEKLEAQATAHAEPFEVDGTLASGIEQIVANGRGYLTRDARLGYGPETVSSSYNALGQSLERMDQATGQDSNSFYLTNPLQAMRYHLDVLEADIETLGLQWVYDMVNAPETVQDSSKAQETIGRMTQLKADMDKYEIPTAYRKMAFKSPDSVDFAWGMREFAIDQARMAVVRSETAKENRETEFSSDILYLSKARENPPEKTTRRKENLSSIEYYDIGNIFGIEDPRTRSKH